MDCFPTEKDTWPCQVGTPSLIRSGRTILLLLLLLECHTLYRNTTYSNLVNKHALTHWFNSNLVLTHHLGAQIHPARYTIVTATMSAPAFLPYAPLALRRTRALQPQLTPPRFAAPRAAPAARRFAAVRMADGPVCVVTGAARGIGRAVALELGGKGCRVVVNYASSAAAADDVVAEVKSVGGDAVAVQGNVGDADGVKGIFQAALDSFGRVDVLVNNAGITADTLLLRMKAKQWQDVIDTNLTGVFMCTQAAAKLMLKQKSGRIVNMTSVVGKIGNPGQVNYAASKAGVIGLTMSAAKECAVRGVTVNAVAPGFINSDMTADLPLDVIKKMIPMGRLGHASEVAGLVRYLALDPSAAYITGHTFSVDGGISIGA